MSVNLPIFIFCFLTVNASIFLGFSQDLYDEEHSAAFAEYLLETGQYDLALSELERLVFLNPEDEELKRKLFSTYIHANNSAAGLRRAEMLYPNAMNIPQEVAPIYASMLLRNKAFERMEKFVLGNENILPDDKFLYLGTNQALRHHWSEAMDYYGKVSPEEKPIVAKYKQITSHAMEQKFKSPALASGLSILIPGAGKVYTRDWKDGLVAFLFVGTTAWQAHRGFSRSGSSSVRGWIFASVSTGFYIGNIFGSHKSAKLYNQRLNERSQKKIEDLFYTDF